MLKSNCRIVLLSIALAVACASSHQIVAFPSQDVAVTRAELTRIYVVREEGGGLSNRAIRVIDGDTEIGQLTLGTYLCWERAPGRTVGRVFYEAVDPSRGRLEGIADLNCGAGRAYYFNVTVDIQDGNPVVREIDPAEGRKLVADRKPASKG